MPCSAADRAAHTTAHARRGGVAARVAAVGAHEAARAGVEADHRAGVAAADDVVWQLPPDAPERGPRRGADDQRVRGRGRDGQQRLSREAFRREHRPTGGPEYREKALPVHRYHLRHCCHCGLGSGLGVRHADMRCRVCV